MMRLIREPGSALTHFLGVVFALAAGGPMLLKAALSGSGTAFAGMLIFMMSLLLLYSASTLYHSVVVRASLLKKFRKIDHMMIFVLIAGSYTPVCLLTLTGREGKILLAVIWCLAAVGMTVKFCWITCPKWFSSAIYIAMGWTCVFVFRDLVEKLSPGAFGWLLAGGIIYTVGGVIYAMKLPLFAQREYFGNHELFHLFVLAGSICHFICMYGYLL